MNIKQPFKKLEKNDKTLKLYVTMMAISIFFMVAFILPFEGARIFSVPLLSLCALTNFCYIWTSVKNPGYVKKSDKVSFLRLNQYFSPAYLCPKCEIIRPKDSNHCHYCNKCVDRFDHHCPFADTCVGHGNHN